MLEFILVVDGWQVSPENLFQFKRNMKMFYIHSCKQLGSTCEHRNGFTLTKRNAHNPGIIYNGHNWISFNRIERKWRIENWKCNKFVVGLEWWSFVNQNTDSPLLLDSLISADIQLFLWLCLFRIVVGFVISISFCSAKNCSWFTKIL